jgi:hypothetical protein
MAEQRFRRAYRDGAKQGLGCCDSSKGSRPRYAETCGRRGLFLSFSSEHDWVDFCGAVESETVVQKDAWIAE